MKRVAFGEPIVLDDAGQYANQAGNRWRLVSLPVRFRTLGEKRNASAALVSADVDAYCVWDDDICRFIRGTPGALYDIGVGPKSEWRSLALAYPRIRVCGCEPHPAQHQALRKARFPGPLVKVAIGENEGIAMFHVPTHDLKCGSLLPVPYANATCEVEVWTLDRFDRQMGCPNRILLWLDVEGSELSALRSGPLLLASGRVRWINLEERRNGHCPAPGWCDPQELRAFLSDHGYVRIADYNRHPTHQDVIYAHREERCSASSR